MRKHSLYWDQNPIPVDLVDSIGGSEKNLDRKSKSFFTKLVDFWKVSGIKCNKGGVSGAFETLDTAGDGQSPDGIPK